MDIVHFISELSTVHSATGLFVVGVVLAAIRPITWRERVDAWGFIHSIAPKAPPHYYDPLTPEDPDGLLPFPMETE